MKTIQKIALVCFGALAFSSAFAQSTSLQKKNIKKAEVSVAPKLQAAELTEKREATPAQQVQPAQVKSTATETKVAPAQFSGKPLQKKSASVKKQAVNSGSTK